MPHSRWNLVLVYDRRSDSYMVLEHNLTAREAHEGIVRRQSGGDPAFVIPQARRHRSPDVADCRICRREIVRHIEKRKEE